MANKSNQPKGLWHELKRRKVFNVVTVYAGTAFVIIQLVAAVKEPLRLPDWFPTVVLVLLGIGFVMAVFFSWVYDITPTGIKITKPSRTEKQAGQPIPKTSQGWKFATYASMVVIVAIAGWYFYPKIFPQDPIKRLQEAGRKLSVAVMPFQNMTRDSSLNFYRLAIQSNLSGNLSNYPEDLTVRQDDVINSIVGDEVKANYASLTPSVAAGVSKKIEASVFIHGNFQKYGNKIIINAQLIDTRTREILKSIPVESTEDQINHNCDSLSKSINNFLILNKLMKERPWIKTSIHTYSPEALKYHLLGSDLRRAGENFYKAEEYLLEALKIDPDFLNAKMELVNTYRYTGKIEKAKEYFMSVYKDKDKYTSSQQNWLEKKYKELFGDPEEVINACIVQEKLDDQNPSWPYNLGLQYNILNQYENAIPHYERAFDLFRKFGIKPNPAALYSGLILAYHKTGQFNKEKQFLKKAEKDFPESIGIIFRHAIFSISMDKKKEIEKYIEKYKTLRKKHSAAESNISYWIGRMYYEADIIDMAEKYLRQAISIDPDLPYLKGGLAFLLIDKELNQTEGMELVEKLLEKSPEDYNFLYTKGLGLYKQMKYKESLELLEKSWKLRRESTEYYHEAWLHLEAARKAVAEMK